MSQIIAILTSLLALSVSAATAWMTLFRRGNVLMTQPTVVFFGPDGGDGIPKVFLRTLLYCTAKTGRVIENMFVQVRRGESRQNFNIWVYGDGPIVRGSGLFISDQGVATNHHFLMPKDGTSFEFLAGSYSIEIFIVYAGSNASKSIMTIAVGLSEPHASQMKDGTSGVYFDWGPDAQTYHAHVDAKPNAKRTESSHDALRFSPTSPSGLLLPR